MKQSLALRTFSNSTTYTAPDDEEDWDDEFVFSDVDSEIEYQLQVKPKSHQLGSPSEGVAEVEVIAVSRHDRGNDEFGGNVESSITMFVNSGFVDVVESKEELSVKKQNTAGATKNSTAKVNYIIILSYIAQSTIMVLPLFDVLTEDC